MLLFLGMTISSATGLYVEKQTIKPLSFGNILYVGGSGPGNYTRIQDAINDSSNGDTVFVYNGIYNEYLYIDREINLVGKSKENTIIHPNGHFHVIEVDYNKVTISGFSLRNSNGDWYNSGIFVHESFTVIENNLIYSNNNYGIEIFTYDNNTITENIIFNNGDGIRILRSRGNNISKNKIFSNKRTGIEISSSSYNIIFDNNISNNSQAVGVYQSNNNTISNNTCINNTGGIDLHSNSYFNILISNNIKGPIDNSIYEKGIHIGGSYNNIINKNTITYYKFGIFLERAYNNMIEMNTFLKNTVNARFIDSENLWSQNYWNRPRIFPKPIFGIKRIDDIIPTFLEFDWNPAQEPYDIGV